MITELLIGLTRGALVIWFTVTALMLLRYAGEPQANLPRRWPLGAFIWPLLIVLFIGALVLDLIDYSPGEALRRRRRR